jgi:phytol kinase
LFLLSQITKFSIFFIISYIGGILVRQNLLKANYTRKINHFLIFFLPVFLDDLFPYERTIQTTSLGFLFLLISLSIYIEKVRNRFNVIQTSFLSFDRPEDRPYTLFWCTTQIAASSIILIILIYYLSIINRLDLVYIPIIISGIGDGLAEPVGVRFGRHQYATTALFSNRRYTRSLEGSLCVLVTSLATVIGFEVSFIGKQFWVALVLFPVIMTITEAKSPHSWDQPFIYLISGLLLIAILQI